MANNHSSNCPNYRHFTMTRALRNPLDLTTSLSLSLSSSRLPVCPPLSDELAVPPSEWRLQFVYTNFMVTSLSSASDSCWPTSLIPSFCSLSPPLPCCHSAWQLLASQWAELTRVALGLNPRPNAQIGGCFATCHAALVHDSRLKLCNSCCGCYTARNVRSERIYIIISKYE